MSGVWILGELLTGNPALTMVVGQNIRGGAFGIDEGLPAVTLNTIGATELKTLTQGTRRRVAERVQASVLARNYEEMKNIIRLVRIAAAGQLGDFAGVTEVSVQLDGTGPDFITENPTVWCGSQDFLISFNELV